MVNKTDKEGIDDDIITSINENEDTEETPEIQFKENWYRWVNLFVFSLYSLANAIYSVSFAPIATLISDKYDVSTFYVNLIYGGTCIGYLLFAIPTNWCIENKGVHFTVILSSIATITGI